MPVKRKRLDQQGAVDGTVKQQKHAEQSASGSSLSWSLALSISVELDGVDAKQNAKLKEGEGEGGVDVQGLLDKLALRNRVLLDTIRFCTTLRLSRSCPCELMQLSRGITAGSIDLCRSIPNYDPFEVALHSWMKINKPYVDVFLQILLQANAFLDPGNYNYALYKCVACGSNTQEHVRALLALPFQLTCTTRKNKMPVGTRHTPPNVITYALRTNYPVWNDEGRNSFVCQMIDRASDQYLNAVEFDTVAGACKRWTPLKAAVETTRPFVVLALLSRFPAVHFAVQDLDANVTEPIRKSLPISPAGVGEDFASVTQLVAVGEHMHKTYHDNIAPLLTYVLVDILSSPDLINIIYLFLISPTATTL